MSPKKQIAIVFGGKSGEHEVSVRSARSIEKNINRDHYQTVALGLTKQGEWRVAPTIDQLVEKGQVRNVDSENTSLLPTPKLLTANVIFPILHGPNGEDGSLQGLLKLINKPYVGSGILGSALAMDKVVQKQVCATAQIPQTPYVWFYRQQWQNKEERKQLIAQIKSQLQSPLFIKPANMGSSVGVSKVKNFKQLNSAIDNAGQYDHKIIVEQAVNQVKEIEVSVLGNNKPKASVCGEIVPNTEFYDYETKYITDDIESQIPAQLPPKISQTIRKLALKTFKVLNCFGLARVDFLYQTKTKQFYLNEVNTLPGFTAISMYPKLWAATDLPYQKLISRLIELAESKWKKEQTLAYEYQPHV